MPLKTLGVTCPTKNALWSKNGQRFNKDYSPRSQTVINKTINSLNGLDPSKFFTFSRDFRPLRANHRFKLKSVSATLNSFKHFFFIRIIDEWNDLPKEIAKAENLNLFKSKHRRYFTSVSAEC